MLPHRFGSVYFSCILLACLNELLGYFAHLWIYASPWQGFVNCFVMFGLVMFCISYLGQSKSAWKLYLIAATVGVIYELSDQFVLHWTHFPAYYFNVFTDQINIRIAYGLLWGITPLIVLKLSAFLSYRLRFTR